MRRFVPLIAAALLALGASPARADNAELITVTKDSAVATWVTSAPSDTTVCWGRRSPTERCRTQETGKTRHYGVMDGLAPGTSYVYELRSGGRAEPTTLPHPGSFTTLTPPGGRHLFDFALLNDTHFGEDCAGTATNAPLVGTSVPPCYSAPDYTGRMNQGMVAEIARRGIQLTIVNGDVTAEARPPEVAQGKEVLGGLPGTVLVARGNHDRVHSGPDYSGCAPTTTASGRAFTPTRHRVASTAARTSAATTS